MKALVLAILVAVLTAAPAFAAGPIKVTSDSFTIADSKQTATFSGNVVILRDGLTVNADEVVVEYGSEGVEDVKTFIATGNVRLRTKDQDATGDRATFNPSTQLMHMTGNVVVVNATGTLTGPELILNLSDNTTVFNGGKGGRVTGTFTTQ